MKSALPFPKLALYRAKGYGVYGLFHAPYQSYFLRGSFVANILHVLLKTELYVYHRLIIGSEVVR